MYRDYFGNIVVPRSPASEAPQPWPHYSASPAPRRTFHNVIRRGRSAPGPSQASSQSPANRTWSGWEGLAGGPGYSRSVVSTDPSVYGDPSVLYDEYQNFAINSNVCMCEDYLDGTNRSKKFKKKCKKCGFDRLGFDQDGPGTVVRRSVSEESINNAMYNDYLRRKRMMNQKPVFYDEQDEYEDIDFISRPMRSSSSRKIKPKSSRSRSPARRSNSPVHKKSARTQSMIVNNRNQLNITKDNKEMQNIAIRASPLRSASSVTGLKPQLSGESTRNVVTVNGCKGATKNSSVIYLSPEVEVLPSSDAPMEYSGVNTTITISTSPPSKLYSQGSIRVSSFDLIKKYIQDSPNSLSDSNLSSDDQHQKSDNKSCESDYSYSDDDPVHDNSTRHFVPSEGSAGSNGFKISGQKIQIYSDGSVTATDTTNIRAYSLSESEDESDKESEYSNYDADCSVMESPRIAIKVSDETPVKPPRRRSAEKDAARIAEDIERLQLQDRGKYKSSPNPDDMRTFPRSSTGRTERVLTDTRNSDSSTGVRKSSVDSSHSGPSRSKSFNGSRESLNLFGSVDFKNLSISKNFSSDVIREVYGSKTSLLKHLDQQREERKLRQSEVDVEAERGRRAREMLVDSLLSKSTDSIMTGRRKSSADKSVSGYNQTGKYVHLTNWESCCQGELSLNITATRTFLVLFASYQTEQS